LADWHKIRRYALGPAVDNMSSLKLSASKQHLRSSTLFLILSDACRRSSSFPQTLPHHPYLVLTKRPSRSLRHPTLPICSIRLYVGMACAHSVCDVRSACLTHCTKFAASPRNRTRCSALQDKQVFQLQASRQNLTYDDLWCVTPATRSGKDSVTC
jgi:hypothetical protein